MNNLWRKQWHENKRYLAAFMAWMVLGACYAIAYQMGHKFRAPVGQFSSVALCYATCAAVFLAMRAARGEHTDGTHSFTAALPVSMHRISTIRILGAVATLILPILAAAVLMSVALSCGFIEQAVPRIAGSHVSLPDRETATLLVASGQLWSVTAIAAFAGLELLLLLSVAGCMPLQHSFLYALAVLGTCWLRKPVIGGFLALAGFAILSVAIGAFPATSPFDPTDVYNKLLSAECAGHMDFTRHGYPLVYGSLALTILIIALFSYWLAKPLQPRLASRNPIAGATLSKRAFTSFCV